MLIDTDIFAQLPTLRAPRVTLRAARMSDAADMYAYSRDPEVARHVLWDAHTSIHQTRGYLRYIIRQYRYGEPSTFVIELNAERRVIGTIGLMWVQKENRSAEVGYSLSRAYWNQGLMTEALNALLRFCFETMRLNRVEAQHEADNPASGAVMRHAGMRREGVLRQRIYNKGRFVDVELYAILRAEYEALHAKGG
ncbi:MAG TPA: GNAT family protein [Candidatus Limiplasma sp.]|nr:GNAT family protein [Candidatus Limiplasma sp.]HPS81847.1 GNAT family protein [Candidatus Limiplasma sp.]